MAFANKFSIERIVLVSICVFWKNTFYLGTSLIFYLINQFDFGCYGYIHPHRLLRPPKYNHTKSARQKDKEEYRMHMQGQKIVRPKDFAFALHRTNDCLMCTLTSKIYSEKLNYTFK